MRPPSDMPRPPRRRRRRLLSGRGRVVVVVVLALLFVLATSLRGIAGFYTDFLWFESLGLSDVWSTAVGAKASLVALFTVGFFVMMWINLAVAERLSGRAVRLGGSSEDDLVLRYRELVGRRALLVRGATSGFLALLAGTGTSGQWDSWILFRNHVPFGKDDATFHVDIGFYVFQLPFLRFVASWLFSALIVVLVATVVAHYLNGGIRMQAAQDRVSSHVKAHVSVLFALLALVQAGRYWLDRYELVFSGRGPVDGASYTDVNVQLRALDLLVMISIFAVGLFIVNIFRRGWALPVLAVGLWGLVAVLAGEVVPAGVQAFRVNPRVSALEAELARNNIDATRAALGLDRIESRPFAADGALTGDDLVANEEAVRNIRLWDTGELREAFTRTQRLNESYDVSEVDVDRYVVDGEAQQVMLATRQLNDSEVVTRGWESERLVYTSGYGAIVAPANAKTGDGQPDLVVRGIPVTSDEGYPSVDQPSLYIGEDQEGYKIVGTAKAEVVRQGDRGREEGGYTGADGVPLDSFVRRVAFALRFGEIEPVISPDIGPESKVLLQRDVVERVEALAPFLTWDSDPYPVLLDGRVLYVIDGFTTTDRYPNAERVDAGDDLEGTDLDGASFNYIRNPVKAVVDAYDGTVNMFVTDEADPILRAYRDAFPDLFAPLDEAPTGLEAHFRYPEDLFRVQTTMWGEYHVDDPTVLIEASDRWQVAAAPDASGQDTPATTTTAPGGTTTSSTSTTAATPGSSTASGSIEPTYQLLRLPGEEAQSFALLRPFTPAASGQLTSYLAATPDGRLVDLDMTGGRNLPEGPGVIAGRMQGNESVSRLLIQLRSQGNDVSFGNLQLVPIEESILYVRPLYVTASANRNPQIKAVVVAIERRGPDGDESQVEVAAGSTLSSALLSLFGQVPETLEAPPEDSEVDDILEGDVSGRPDDPEPPPETPEGTFTGSDAELAAAVEAAFDEADDLFRTGDTEGWVAALERAEDLARQLAARLEGSGGAGEPGEGEAPAPTTTTAPPSTSAPPSTTAPPDGTTTTSRPSA